MPDAKLPSDTNLNSPISPVFLTCVPPHNSIEYALLVSLSSIPISITLTSSPYFSPNIAIAPFATASSFFKIDWVTGEQSNILLLISFSIDISVS